MLKGEKFARLNGTCADPMTLKLMRRCAAVAVGAIVIAGAGLAQAQNAQSNTAPQSPYGGAVVEEIVARVNDQIITRSDYERAMRELDQEARQRGATTMQEIAAGHKDLLRSLIDQQLWLSKGKQLGIKGDTELIKQLNEIRKQYNLSSMEDLEKAAREQGVSFDDFKANIRNNIITRLVMQQEVGGKIQVTPGEAERYYERHKKNYMQPESVRLSEILVAADTKDQAKLATAKAKADDIETRIHAGGDFAQLAKSFSEGPTAGEGGDLGQYQRGALSKLLEDKTFALKSGEVTEPILTRQGYVILKVVEHAQGGAKPYKQVQEQVEEAFYMERMEPAIRAYLTKMREEAFIDIRAGYADTGASPKETKPVYSAYVPPSPKKKAKVERVRFRETAHGSRQKNEAGPETVAMATSAAVATTTTKAGKKKNQTPGIERPGKREKIRYGQKPRETLPAVPTKVVEDAGALPEGQQPEAGAPVNPLEPAAPTVKSRFGARARLPKQPKQKLTLDSTAPLAPDAEEVADRQSQAGPLGLNGATAEQQKKAATATGDKTRLSKKKKAKKQSREQHEQQNFTPLPELKGAPAPKQAPADQPTTK